MSLLPERDEWQQDQEPDDDFCYCLERIDLLYQQEYLLRMGLSSTGTSPFLLNIEEIGERLTFPRGKPCWMDNNDVLLPDTEEALNARLESLVTAFDLTTCERDILLAALLSRLSDHYAALPESYLQGGVNRKLLTYLFSDTQIEYRLLQSALHPSSPLFVFHLLGENTPAVNKSSVLSAHDAIWHFFCGNGALVGHQNPTARWVEADSSGWYPLSLCENLVELCLQPGTAPQPVVLLEGHPQDGRELAVANIAADYGYTTRCLNIETLTDLPQDQQLKVMAELLRDALLYKSVLLLENSGELLSEKRGYARALERLLLQIKLPVIILTEADADVPFFMALASVHLVMPALTLNEKAAFLETVWPVRPGTQLKSALLTLAGRYTFDPADLPLLIQEADHYRQVKGERSLTPEDLRQALARRSRKNFGKLAQRITPTRTFDDLILSPALKQQIAEIIDAIKLRESVTQKHFAHKLGGKTGVSALFYGDSGTGKTLAAEVLANYLSVDLIKIDLSTVVNKYVGETEKNLARIFDLAQADSGVLFFDEADALFGKRSETKDAHDRHANIEVSYLLQRLDNYPGLVILATNNRNHLDSAFNRRFTFITRFTYPDVALRQQMWQAIWPQTLKLADDVNFAGLAAKTEFTGANIRNIALLAAVLAARDNSEVIALAHIERAISRELGKAGRLSL